MLLLSKYGILYISTVLCANSHVVHHIWFVIQRRHAYIYFSYNSDVSQVGGVFLPPNSNGVLKGYTLALVFCRKSVNGEVLCVPIDKRVFTSNSVNNLT